MPKNALSFLVALLMKLLKSIIVSTAIVKTHLMLSKVCSKQYIGSPTETFPWNNYKPCQKKSDRERAACNSILMNRF